MTELEYDFIKCANLIENNKFQYVNFNDILVEDLKLQNWKIIENTAQLLIKISLKYNQRKILT